MLARLTVPHVYIGVDHWEPLSNEKDDELSFRWGIPRRTPQLPATRFGFGGSDNDSMNDPLQREAQVCQQASSTSNVIADSLASLKLLLETCQGFEGMPTYPMGLLFDVELMVGRAG